MLLLIARIIGSFSSYGKRGMIAFAMATGITLAFIPGGTLLWFIIFIPMMFIRINQAALVGMMALGRILMVYIDPFSERFGYYILTRPQLIQPMGRLLSFPLINWLRLNDSLVAGGLILGTAGWPVWFLLSLLFIGLYRRFFAGRIKTLFQKIGDKIPVLKKLGLAVTAVRKSGALS